MLLWPNLQEPVGRSEESAATPPIPDPEVSEKRQRRRFTARYKRSIVEQAEACQNTGDVGALLRREGLYSSSLSSWRRQYRQGALDSLNAQPRGPKPRPNAVQHREVSHLEKRVAKLEHELVKAHTIIDVQKNSRRYWPICRIRRNHNASH